MALAPVGVSSISLFKAASLDINGNNWVSNGCCALAPSSTDATRVAALKSAGLRKLVACSAVQESSTPTVSAEEKEGKAEVKSEVKEEKAEAKPAAKEKKAEAKPAAAKPKAAAKAPAKPLPQMMEEDIIPSLRSTLDAQEDLADLELAFEDNTLKGSFLEKGIPYSFWAFFPDGSLTGAKGFAFTSYGMEVSTVEPFLIDEKKITPKHVVFWVEKRLAAQGIIDVWERK